MPMPRAALFANYGTPLYEASAAGLKAAGYEVVGQAPGAWSPSQAERGVDLAFVHGLRGKLGEIADFHGKLKIPIVIYDLPHLRKPGQNRITPMDHGWLPEFEDGDVPFDRLDALGVEIQERRRVKGLSVLLAGQVSGDSAHGMDGAKYRKWVEHTIKTLRAVCDSEIVWRAHQDDPWRAEGVDGYSDARTETLAEALEKSWLLVTYNSTSGLEALISGLPVVAEGPAVYGALAHRLNQFAKIGPPDPKALRELLARIAYTQFTLEELATGTPILAALGKHAWPAAPPVEIAKGDKDTKAGAIEPAAPAEKSEPESAPEAKAEEAPKPEAPKPATPAEAPVHAAKASPAPEPAKPAAKVKK